MKRKIITAIIITLLVSTTTISVLGNSETRDFLNDKKPQVSALLLHEITDFLTNLASASPPNLQKEITALQEKVKNVNILLSE